MPARYKHDCDTCTYLGQLKNYDIYNCREDSIIARYGNKGREYASWGMPEAADVVEDGKVKNILVDAYKFYLKIKKQRREQCQNLMNG